MQLVRNSRGSALLSVFIVAVVLAALMPSMYFLMLNSATNQVKRGDVEDFTFMIQALRSQLEDPFQCYKLLGGRTVPAVYKGRVNNLSLSWQYSTSKSAVLAKGWKVPGAEITIEDVVLVRSGIVPPPGNTVKIKTGGSLLNYTTVPLRVYVYPKEIGLNFADDTSASPESPELLSPMIRRELMIRILANVDSSGKIYNCFGHQSFAGACQAAGGAYNHLGPDDLKCQPNVICFTGNLGVVTDPNRCNTVGSIPYKAVKLSHGTTPLYLCQLCAKDL